MQTHNIRVVVSNVHNDLLVGKATGHLLNLLHLKNLELLSGFCCAWHCAVLCYSMLSNLDTLPGTEEYLH